MSDALPPFAQQLEEARKRLGLPENATAWEIMLANASHEAVTGEMWRRMWQDIAANNGRISFSRLDPDEW